MVDESIHVLICTELVVIQLCIVVTLVVVDDRW